MQRLRSFVGGDWVSGSEPASVLVNPATEEPIAETSTAGVDMAAALAHARERGGPSLRALTFAERGALLGAMAKSIHARREELLALAVQNGGNTRSDAKFDIDGAMATLSAYAELGAQLGDTTVLPDGDGVQLGRTARLFGQHVLVPRRGAAVHINAFNFPGWGLAEKAATALLAGMPVVTKPATSTALVAYRMVEGFVEDGALPEGALSLIAGAPGDLLSHLRPEDVLAFTGSSDTAARLRGIDAAVAGSLPVNVEADSLNAAVLGPDVSPGSETFGLFVADAARDITQKAGQKCTAIRRIFVPEARLDEVLEALRERLGDVVVGDPSHDGVRMGPLTSEAQLRDIRAGIAALAEVTEEVYGGLGEIEPVGAPAGKGYFVGPVLRLARDPRAALVHEREVFGPVATVVPYSGDALEVAELVALGGGGLVASVYSDDRAYLAKVVPELAPCHGRLYLGSAKMASQSPGPGTVLPLLCHGGPGRAGGGEELGGLRGMRLYQQRTALEGDKSLIGALFR
jgi:3,4-dehydroadipyl-CoA semialdehyde dehydrogenase